MQNTNTTATQERTYFNATEGLKTETSHTPSTQQPQTIRSEFRDFLHT